MPERSRITIAQKEIDDSRLTDWRAGTIVDSRLTNWRTGKIEKAKEEKERE
jgi:hypothetical protein